MSFTLQHCKTTTIKKRKTKKTYWTCMTSREQEAQNWFVSKEQIKNKNKNEKGKTKQSE